MAGRHILAVDEGTTGVTALVLDESLAVAGRSYRELPTVFPRPGWVEQDASVLWRFTLDAMERAVRDADLRWKDVAGIGIANQRETTVVWDRRTGKPLAPAIVWQDRRTAERCRELSSKARKLRSRTGLVVDPYFSATKLEWLLGNVRGLRSAAEAGHAAFGTVDSWLAWNLTGGKAHVTDETNASRTLLWDIHAGAWDAELLGLFGVPDRMLPEVVPSSHVLGETDRAAVGAEVPVAALVGDQQAALFGQHCRRAGEAKNTYGTGCFLLQHTGGEAVRSRHGLLTTRAARTGSAAQFALEGSVFVAGAVIQWLRDGLGLFRESPDVDRLAAEVPDAGGVHIVPAFTGLGAPHWDAEARGAVLGLTRGTDRRHLSRAALESIAFQSADVLRAMEKDSKREIPALRVDGGAAKSDLLLQFQADLLQRPVVRPESVETTALGAGMLAGLAVGLWDESDLRGHGEDARVFEPAMPAEEARRRTATWQKAVAATRAFKP